MRRRLFVTVAALVMCVAGVALLLSADVGPGGRALGMAASAHALAADEPQWGPDIQVNPRVTVTPSTQKNFSLAINPTNPNNVIAGYNSSNPDLGLSGYAASTDAGRTWTGGLLRGPWGPKEPMTPLGDANVAFDAWGTGYYSSVAVGSTTSGYFVLTTTNGLQWSQPMPVVISDYSVSRSQTDLAVDPSAKGPFAGSLYLVWLQTLNANPFADGVQMRYSRDGGATWSDNVSISDPGHEFIYGPQVAVASNGTVYAAFEQLDDYYIFNPPKLYLDRSTDGGETWSADKLISGAAITSMGRPDYKDRELTLIGSAACNLVRVNHFPSIAVSPNDPNTVYAVWNDGRWETQTTLCGRAGRHSDIAFSKSTDAGGTWTSAARLNDDDLGNGIDQFQPTIAVRADGLVGVTWHDRRYDRSTFLYDIAYTQSTDGGQTWLPNRRVSDVSSDPDRVPDFKSIDDLGSRNSLVYGPDYVLPAWLDTRLGTRQGDFFTDRGVFTTPTPTSTPTPASTSTLIPTSTPTATLTRTPSSTATRTFTQAPTVTSTPVPACTPGWNLVGSPNIANTNNILNDIAAVSPTDMWAVGAYATASVYHTLTMHWDGSTWTIVPSPNVGTATNILNGVAAVASNSVWAVGYGSDNTLALHWDGSAWSVVPTGLVGRLQAVSPRAANDIWAVGSLGLENLDLTMHWDGTSWTQVPCSSPGTLANSLNGVTAISPTDVWAVGYAASSQTSNVILHWNGTSWTQVPCPDQGFDDFLNDVAAVNATDIWAVGSYSNGAGREGPTLLHWDGTSWTTGNAASVQAARLVSVSVLSASRAWAVGYLHFGGSMVIMQWDGSAWTQNTNPNIAISALNGVVALAPDNIWAVGAGRDTGGNFDQTLVTQATNPCVTGTATATPRATNTSTATYTPTATFSRTATRTRTATSTVQSTATATNTTTTGTSTPPVPTTTPSPTSSPTGTGALTPSVTPSPCAIQFTDVHPTDYFYEPVRYLYCRGVISGYNDNTFRPYNLTTRGQLAKIVVLAQGWTLYTPPSPTFRDVPLDNAFYGYVETAYNGGIISGYTCGPACLEYRPGNNVTRGQLAKIVVLAETWPLYTPPSPTFRDVPIDNAFYAYIETAYHHNIITGYECGPACLEFRPGNNATRGQISKIVYIAVTSP